MEAQFDSAISSTMAPTASTTSTTSARNEELIPLYLRQLHNYAYASEHAAPCCLSLKPVSKLRLLVFGPGAFVHRESGKSGVADGPESEQARLKLENDVWIQRRRVARASRRSWPGHEPLELARILAERDPRLAAMIARVEFERLLRLSRALKSSRFIFNSDKILGKEPPPPSQADPSPVAEEDCAHR